jgi:hypothetical protein
MIASDTCSGHSIGPKGKCAIGLEFSPPPGSTPGTIPGTLGIGFTYGSNDGSVPAITLTGKVK